MSDESTLRERIAEALARAGEPEKYQRTPPPERIAYYWQTLADALLPFVQREIEAAQAKPLRALGLHTDSELDEAFERGKGRVATAIKLLQPFEAYTAGGLRREVVALADIRRALEATA